MSGSHILQSSIEPYSRVEFAFVLLPNSDQLQQLNILAQALYDALQHAKRLDVTSPEWGTYQNRKLVMPHMSIGQYGALGTDVDQLCCIAAAVARETPVMPQRMCDTLSFWGSHLFFDATECHESVNPHMREAYIHLRNMYFDTIETRFPIAQAHLARKRLANDPEELALIDHYFQNWMLPERNQMRPHFTLMYHLPFEKESMAAILENHPAVTQLLSELSLITLTHLGVLRIDTFGNPIPGGLLCSYPLNGGV